jgi:hypothetical protein
MKYLPKDVHKLKDKELLEHLFPKEVLRKVKEDAEKPRPRKSAKKS